MHLKSDLIYPKMNMCKHLEFCKKVLEEKPLQMEELVQFTVDYCEHCNKSISSEELNIIIQFLQMGHFSLIYAVTEHLLDHKLHVHTLISKNGEVLRRWI